jgi:hypothetical protein
MASRESLGRQRGSRWESLRQRAARTVGPAQRPAAGTPDTLASYRLAVYGLRAQRTSRALQQFRQAACRCPTALLQHRFRAGGRRDGRSPDRSDSGRQSPPERLAALALLSSRRPQRRSLRPGRLVAPSGHRARESPAGSELDRERFEEGVSIGIAKRYVCCPLRRMYEHPHLVHEMLMCPGLQFFV